MIQYNLKAQSVKCWGGFSILNNKCYPFATYSNATENILPSKSNITYCIYFSSWLTKYG